MAKKPRIPLNAEQTGLNPAFAGLSLSGLPSGPAEPVEEAAGERAAPKAGRVVLRKERAGRGGKTVIVIDEFAPHFTAADLEELARRLRGACGCGGTVKERTIEMQGDQPGRIREFLQGEGFRVAGV
jgi:translation initiation factor 1